MGKFPCDGKQGGYIGVGWEKKGDEESEAEWEGRRLERRREKQRR